MYSSSSSEEGEIHEGPQANLQEPQPNLQANEKIFMLAETTYQKPVLLADGFEYCYEADSKIAEGIEIYRCIQRSPYCQGRIHVNSAVQLDANGRQYKIGKVKNANHNHQATHASVRRAQMNLMASARVENPTSTRLAVDITRANIPEEIRATIAPTSSAMGRSFRLEVARQRGEFGDNLLDVQDPDAIVIGQNLRPITIFDGYVEGQRVIVFMSDFGRNMLQLYGQNIAIDGTFKVAPSPFTQLYNISGIHDYVAIPSAYGLLLSKNAQHYRAIFAGIKRVIPNWAPITVMSDFEQAAIVAVREEFPQAIHSGCLFHLAQSLYKKVQTLPNLNALFWMGIRKGIRQKH